MGEYDDLLRLAHEVARDAGRLVAGLRSAGVDVSDTKSSGTDIVTEADRASEELIRRRLLGARPEDGFLGEEGEGIAGSSGVEWVVDPIDGTVNYFLGLPNYAVSIAAARDGQVVAGVVLNPVSGEEYTAARGSGAARNGRPISTRDPRPVARMVVSTGFSYEAAVRSRQAQAVAGLLAEVADIRRFGSCALDLCAVACGQSDGYVEEGVHPWDHAAAGLVAEEAGARVELGRGANGRTLVTAAPAASFPEFRALVARCGFTGPEGWASPAGV
ncbi:MAG TPA: inositol monophosphatase family protein [Marmoricola sp.]|jgi:myo-inositol-1(or 4)-monophosphatase|nr:inositol monophosphatase family protein [Marmoricola sp.]